MFASFFSKKNSPFLMFFLKLLYISKFSIFLFFKKNVLIFIFFGKSKILLQMFVVWGILYFNYVGEFD